jgi:hypothetical protein
MIHKLALLAAAASLTIAGAAAAQSTQTTPNPTTAPSSNPAMTPTTPMGPAQSTTPSPSTGSGAPMSPQTMPGSGAHPADSAGQPTSATAASYKVGSAVKDAQGVAVGQITGTSTGADGSTNVIVTNGGVKFALPANSLSATADGGVQTTATKAQIDATVAAAKPQ